MKLDIPLYRLHNQHLLQDKFNQPAEVVRRLGAVQAQDFAGAKWAIGLRSNRLTDSDVERAFTDGSFLRTHLLRPTWHFVAPEDIRWMLALTAPRVRAQLAYMDRQLELDQTFFRKSKALLVRTLQGGNQFTRAELERAFQQAHIPAAGQRLGHLLMHAELDGLICSGPRRGKQFTYMLLEERVPAVKTRSRDESLAELVRRYFLTRGPATFKDFCVWSGMTLADARNGMDMVKTEFVNEIVDDQSYWFSGSVTPGPRNSPLAHLLPNYDEYFIGFKDRSAIGKLADQAGIKRNDPALLANLLLLNGQAAGGWRRTLKQDAVIVEVSLITRLAKAEEQAVRGAAEEFGRFLGLPVTFIQKESSNEQRTTRSF